MKKGPGSGWHKESERHSRARKYGRAGGSRYADRSKKRNNTSDKLCWYQSENGGMLQGREGDILLREPDSEGMPMLESGYRHGRFDEDGSGGYPIYDLETGEKIGIAYPDGNKYRLYTE